MEGQTPQGMENRPQDMQQGPPQQPQYGGPQDAPPPGQAPPPQGYDPYQRPSTDQLIQSSYPKGRRSFERFFAKDKLSMLITLGVIFMFIGALLATIFLASQPPSTWDEKYDGDEDGMIDDQGKSEQFIKDARAHKGGRSMGILLGGILLEFGMLLLIMALLGGGILNQDLDNYARLGMIIAAGIIIAFELLFLGKLIDFQIAQEIFPNLP